MKANVIGCGPWAQNHIRILSELDLLNGVYDLNKGLTRDIALKFECKALTEKKILNSELKDNCLFIATSVNSHYNLIKKYIPYYKYIFVEKPIVQNLKQYKILKKLIKKYKNKIFVGHLINYHPAFQELKKFVLEKKIGSVLGIRAIRHNFGRYRIQEDVIESLAIHDLSILFNLAKALKLKLKTSNIIGFDFYKKNHFDESRIFLNFTDNVKAIVSSSWTSIEKNHTFLVNGSKGVIVFNDVNPIDTKLHVQYFNKTKHNIEKTFTQNLNIKNKIEPLKNEIIQVVKYFLGDEKACLSNFNESYNLIKVIDRYKRKIDHNH